MLDERARLAHLSRDGFVRLCPEERDRVSNSQRGGQIAADSEQHAVANHAQASLGTFAGDVGEGGDGEIRCLLLHQPTHRHELRIRARRIRAMVAGLALGLVVAGCAAEPLPLPPMPSDLKVVAPPLVVPHENARFAGRWIGKWEAQLEHMLVVELVVQNEQTTEVTAVYSGVISAELGVNTPGWTRVRGHIENGALRLELTRAQATAEYTMQAEGAQAGE